MAFVMCAGNKFLARFSSLGMTIFLAKWSWPEIRLDKSTKKNRIFHAVTNSLANSTSLFRKWPRKLSRREKFCFFSWFVMSNFWPGPFGRGNCHAEGWKTGVKNSEWHRLAMEFVTCAHDRTIWQRKLLRRGTKTGMTNLKWVCLALRN